MPFFIFSTFSILYAKNLVKLHNLYVGTNSAAILSPPKRRSFPFGKLLLSMLKKSTSFNCYSFG